ncbi:hypothetical protein Pen02_36660 [Plantactinospora endophytica]|uniref:4Fe-4S Wbl-type domain-containing protein n=1 Tax=Plantactinospora endophytica TaxID=673535 RepID=A0ABQ4E1Z1_9ACTN|nr:hypothetical protein Pen02_36660 [Plantactinospora endophytica]
MSDEMAAHFRDTMLTHANDPVTGVCVRCGRSRCDEWRWAYERLVLAGRLDDLPRHRAAGGGKSTADPGVAG